LTTGSVRYQRNPDYIFRKIVDELVLVPIRQNTADMDCIYTMNPVAALIWDRLESPTAVCDIEQAIVSEFEVDPQAAATDLLEFLQALESAGAARRV
jgi:hypothetical protein